MKKNKSETKIADHIFTDKPFFTDKPLIRTRYELFWYFISLLNKNQGVKIYSTWGVGANLKEWKKEVAKIDFVKLVSPSMAARVPKGTKKFEFMLSDWTEKITLV